MSEVVFRAGSKNDLALPLQQAYAEALAQGRAFRLILPCLDYEPFHVSLGSLAGETIDLRVEGEGDMPVTLRGISMALCGRRVGLRNLVFRSTSTPASALTVHAVDSFEGERLGFVQIHRHDPMSNEPIVQISAMGPKDHTADAAVRECWFVSNEGEGFSAVLSTPRSGKSHIRRLLIERSAFLGNRTRVGLDPWFTRFLELDDVLVLENDADPWLQLRSPLVRVRLRNSLLSSGSTLVEFLTGPDVARSDFPPVVASRCRLLTTAPMSPADVASSDGATGAPLPTPSDWKDIIRLCGHPPDREALESLLAAQHSSSATLVSP